MSVMEVLVPRADPEWTLASIGEACEINPRTKVTFERRVEVTFIPMQAVDAELGEVTAPQIRPIGEVQKGYTRFQDGDVIFAKITPCMENGKAAIALDLIGGIGFGSTEFHVLRPKEGTLAEWIYYFIRQEWFRDYARDNFTGTAGQRRVPTEFLKNVEIPLPPLDEQRRIVGVLREALAEVRRGREALGQVAGQMKRFRQAVLAQAFRGELTAEWREAHADRFREAAEAYDALLIERGGAAPRSEDLPTPLRDWLPADRLREVILADRRARWESAQLAKMAAKGGPKDDKWKAKYVESKVVAQPDSPDEPDLPITWAAATVGECVEVGTGATPLSKRADYYDGGSIPWATSGDLHGSVITSVAGRITEKALNETNCKVFPPGTLLVAMYGEGQTRGRVAELGIAAATNQACAALLFHADNVALRPWLKAFEVKNYEEIRNIATGGVQPNLNLTIIKDTLVPLAPLAEQREIVTRIEALFAQAEATESTAATALNNLRRLEQSTLRAAFAGEL